MALLPYADVVRTAWRISRPGTALVALASLLTAALPVGAALVTGALLGALPAAVADGLGSPGGHAALTAVAVLAGLFLAGWAAEELRTVLGDALGRRVDVRLQQRLMRAAAGPPTLDFVESRRAQDLIGQVREGVSTGWWTPGGMLAPLAGSAALLLQVLGAAALVAPFRWWLALALLAAWAVSHGALRRAFLLHTRAANEQATLLRRAGYLRDLALTGPAAKELRLWGMLDWLTARFSAEWWKTLAPQWHARRELAPISAAVVLGFHAVQVVSLATVGVAAARAEIDLAALGVLLAAIARIDPMAGLNDGALRLARGASSLVALGALEREAGVDGRRWKVGGSHPPSPIHRLPPGRLPQSAPAREIVFERVTFQYPGQPVPTLSNLELRIPAGTSLAVVGVNGAGKTTLAKLLCGLYTPTGGRILVDGVDLTAVEPGAWQRRVAAIFQDFVRFDLSARDNVRLGAVDLQGWRDPLVRAARRSGALPVVDALPHGWDTVLARQYEGGTDLSGGQWQRVALARALYAVEAGAQVLLLDEPTASLDARAEAEFYERFLEITRGLTTLLISHRFSSVRRADRMCVLADGAIAEQGTHSDLLAAGGPYARMFSLQAAAFTEPGESADLPVGAGAPAGPPSIGTEVPLSRGEGPARPDQDNLNREVRHAS